LPDLGLNTFWETTAVRTRTDDAASVEEIVGAHGGTASEFRACSNRIGCFRVAGTTQGGEAERECAKQEQSGAHVFSFSGPVNRCDRLMQRLSAWC
jgi:hypothetical protein